MKTAIKYPYGGGNGTAKRNKQNILRSPRETIKRAERRTRPKEESKNVGGEHAQIFAPSFATAKLLSVGNVGRRTTKKHCMVCKTCS